MPLIPFIMYGTITDSSGTAKANAFVWITNETTNQRVVVQTNDVGQYIYDLANMDEYSDGDAITVAIVAYANSGYILKRDNPFEDTSVDILEFEGERINTATLTMNVVIR